MRQLRCTATGRQTIALEKVRIVAATVIGLRAGESVVLVDEVTLEEGSGLGVTTGAAADCR